MNKLFSRLKRSRYHRMDFADERDVFFYLLSNFLDWNSPELLSSLTSDPSHSMPPRSIPSRSGSRTFRLGPSLDYVDELSLFLPERYRDIGEDCIQFLMSLLPRLQRGLDETDISSIHEFVNSLRHSESKYSDYSYVFPFSMTSRIPSYAFTILMKIGCDLSVPDRYGRLVTDILDYISPTQWRMLLERRYDLTNPIATCDILDKMALSIYMTRDEIESRLDLLFNRELFTEVLFQSTRRDLNETMRPGIALSLLIEELWTLEFQEQYPNTLGLLLIMNNAVTRLYPEQERSDLELAFRHRFIEKNLESCYKGISTISLTEVTPWELLLDNTCRCELLYSVNVMKTAESITLTHLTTTSNGILISSRFAEWMLRTQCSKESTLEYIRTTALNAVTELSMEDSWELYIFLGKAIELETMPTNKDRALHTLMETALQWSLSLKPTLSWVDILDTARDFGLVSFPADKETLISSIRLNFG